MKKRYLLLAFVLVFLIVSLCVTVACDFTIKNDHKHTFSNEWTYDETYHWREATCEHTSEVSDRANHSFNGNSCSICGYKQNTITNYTVTFDANNGSFANATIREVAVEANSLLSNTEEPVRNGYIFDGWATNTNGNQKWNFDNDKVECNITLYAVWLQEFVVIFDANGGKFSNDEDRIYVDSYRGAKITLVKTPTRVGYEFDAWYKDSELTQVWNFNSDTIELDITLYAGWTSVAVEYDVTFVLNYAEAEDVVESTVNGLITYVPTREGYVFNGWWISEGQTSDGSNILTQRWETTKAVENKGLILYAEWVEESTVASQLPAPSISINEGVLSWSEVPNAQSYRVIVLESGSNKELYDESVTGISWTFPSNYKEGSYNIKIRSNGDGLNTVNSAYVTKSYAHRILATPSNIKFDMSTSVLTWSAVKYAKQYSLYVDNVLVDELTYTAFDMSNYDAGIYDIRIVASNNEFISSSASKQINKFRLKTPESTLQVNKDTLEYVLSWKTVYGADAYIIKVNDTEIRTNTLSYIIGNDNVIWNDFTSAVLSVNAYDSSADHLVSINATEYKIGKLYNLIIGSDIEGAGNLDVSGNLFAEQEYTVKFDLNGANGSVESQTVTVSKGLIYPSIPSRLGYVFGGWCTDKYGKNVFDFESEVVKDMVLYARWYEITTNGNSNNVISIIDGNNTWGNYYSFKNDATTSSNADHAYFTIHATGEYTLYYVAFSYSNSGQGAYYYIYNATQQKVILRNTLCRSGTWTDSKLSFSANAGDVIYVRSYRYNINKYTNAWFCVMGGKYPTGITCNDKFYMSVDSNAKGNVISCENETLTIKATALSGNYTFLGWYDGETLLTESMAYTFTMPSKNINYTAKWSKKHQLHK